MDREIEIQTEIKTRQKNKKQNRHNLIKTQADYLTQINYFKLEVMNLKYQQKRIYKQT